MMIRQQAGATVATTDNSNTPLSHTSQATSDLEILVFGFWALQFCDKRKAEKMTTHIFSKSKCTKSEYSLVVALDTTYNIGLPLTCSALPQQLKYLPLEEHDDRE